MEIHIESPHVKLSPLLEQQVRSKFGHLSRKFQRIQFSEITFRKEKCKEHNSCCVEVVLHVPGTRFFASEKEKSFETALENVLADLEHQLLRQKEEAEEKR